MKSKILFTLALLALLSPNLTLAFTPENGTVTRLTNDTWLYLNVAEYGSPDGEVSLPIATAPSWMPRISGQYLRYQVLLSDQVIAGLDTNAMLLSDAPIDDNRYLVPAGQSHSFILMALITLSDPVSPGEQIDLSLEVTSEITSGK
jgi:hypothetical protein